MVRFLSAKVNLAYVCINTLLKCSLESSNHNRTNKYKPTMICAQPGSDERTAKAMLPKPAPYLWPDTLHLK